MSTGLFTEVNRQANCWAEQQQVRARTHTHAHIHTDPARSHVDSRWQVYLSFCRSVFFRCPRWNSGWNVESRALRYVLVLACRWLPLRGRGMCGIHLNMSVSGLRHKVTWASREIPWFEVMVVAIIVCPFFLNWHLKLLQILQIIQSIKNSILIVGIYKVDFTQGTHWQAYSYRFIVKCLLINSSSVFIHEIFLWFL